MKPPAFKYHDPTTLAEALDLLALYGDTAKVLAGGQSLVPLLNFRLATPAHVIDLNRIAELDQVSRSDGHLRLGAMLRQRTLERSIDIAEACPLIAQATPFVGHAQIRNRGTLGGSLAHADPAAELPAVALAVDAQLTLQSTRGQRVVGADDFFIGELTTALRPDELLVGVEVPVVTDRTGSSVQEVAMRSGDFALAGVAASLRLTPTGSIAGARIVCFGVGSRPMRMRSAEASLADVLPTDEHFAEAGRIVSSQVDAVADMHASAEYRKRAAGFLARRALAACLRRVAA